MLPGNRETLTREVPAPFDALAAGVRSDATLRVDRMDLPRLASRIAGDELVDHVQGVVSLCEQVESPPDRRRDSSVPASTVAPTPLPACGHSAPTAKKRLATATPSAPSGARATIDQVMQTLSPTLATRGAAASARILTRRL